MSDHLHTVLKYVCDVSLKPIPVCTLCRSKAPNKKRGLLWAYIQERTQSIPGGDDREAFMRTVTRLNGSQDLPSYVQVSQP